MMPFIRMIALALALAASLAWSSHPSESARNQYEAGENRPQPHLLSEATDHPPEVHMSQQPASGKQLNASDLQVGCGDGFIQEKSQVKSELDKNKPLRPVKHRRKRSYTPWTSQQVVYSVPYQSINVWRPPVYQLSRPYYIPIYGVSGRIPIYYPPQPLFVNPGAPKDNPPKKPFQGPTYLPPPTPAPKPDGTTMKLEDRFNGGDNTDDKPVWDKVDSNQRPTTPSSIVPTRATRPPGASNVPPPLIHNPTDPQGVLNEPETNAIFTTPTPPARPATPGEPSRCVWAIISCCSTTDQISYDCFDQRGCPGAFWDTNPCDSDFARAAIQAALNYYNK